MGTLFLIAAVVMGLAAARNKPQAKKVVIDLRDLLKFKAD
jgi:hypothetical protein